MDEDCLGLVVWRPGGGCNAVLYLRQMSQIRNASSLMGSNPDTIRILMSRVHSTDGDIQRRCDYTLGLNTNF